jgi:hypothetical protein
VTAPSHNQPDGRATVPLEAPCLGSRAQRAIGEADAEGALDRERRHRKLRGTLHEATPRNQKPPRSTRQALVLAGLGAFGGELLLVAAVAEEGEAQDDQGDADGG